MDIETPDVATMEAELVPVVNRCMEVAITTVDEHRVALEVLVEVDRRVKVVREAFAEPKKKAHEAHRAITALESKLLSGLQGARRLLSDKVAGWEQQQASLARARQAELEAEARRQQQAASAIDELDAAEAGEAPPPPLPPPVVHVEPEVAQVAGVSSRTTYSAEVTNLHELVRFVASTPSMLELVQPNMPALNRMAVALRDGFSIPGVIAKTTTTKVVRR